MDLIKQSNGHVAIYSELNLGTTVRLYLPGAKNAAIPVAEGGGRQVGDTARI